jgi:hypothetical protein
LFRPDPSLTHVPVSREQVVAVIESINQPQISIPGKPPQAALGLIIGLRRADGAFTILVGLHLRQTGENVIYVHERSQVPLEAYREVEAEGVQFLESMGFMLDNLNYAKLPPEAQEQALRRVPIFHPPRPVAPAAASVLRTSPRQALVRLLAGF